MVIGARAWAELVDPCDDAVAEGLEAGAGVVFPHPAVDIPTAATTAIVVASNNTRDRAFIINLFCDNDLTSTWWRPSVCGGR